MEGIGGYTLRPENPHQTKVIAIYDSNKANIDVRKWYLAID